MRKLHTFGLHEHGLAGLLRDLLEQEGIICVIKNEKLSIGLGEIPFVELFPELWVVDEEVLPRARHLLQQWLTDQQPPAQQWTCPGCGERLEGQFGSCWHCGRNRGD